MIGVINYPSPVADPEGGAKGYAPQTHNRLKKICVSSCRCDSVFRRWQ